MLNPWWNKVEHGLTDEESDRMEAGLGSYLDEHGIDEAAWDAAEQPAGESFSDWVDGLVLDHSRCDVLGPEHQAWGLFPDWMQDDAMMVREELGEKVEDVVPS